MKDSNIVEYHEPFSAGFRVSFFPAGHIMGSAITMVEDKKRIVFSGDICMRRTRVLDPCEKNLRAQTLIVESTYGGRDDQLPSYKDSYQKMIKIINKTLDRGGHVIIPSFAVGRAQEVLMALDDYMRSGALRPTRIYVEGMINKAMKIYRHNAIYANEDIKRRILMSEDDPFKSPNFHRSKSKTKEDVLEEPSIIVTTSGMLTGGPVMYYLEKLGGDPKNTLIFVGYQAEGTLGNKVLKGKKQIQIGDKEVELKLEIESVKLSGHADFNELLQFVKSFKGLEKVFIIHGEKTDLKDHLEKDYEVIVPKLLETYSL
jgi:predicted metal-dependent RNase